MTPGEYASLRHEAVRLPDEGGYCLGRAEMNPAVFWKFVDEMLERCLPRVLW